MSRIDDAMKRLAGVVSPDPRPPQVLDRFASEGDVSKIEEPKRVQRVEGRRLANFVAPGPHLVEERPVAPKGAVEHPTSQRLERPPADPAREREPEVEKLIDVRQIADYAGFVIRSVGRHKLLAAGTCLLTLSMTVGAGLLMPKTYHVQVKLLAQRNAVMTALSNPGRAVPWDADAPTRAAAETVLRRDNLISLVTQTDLINEWDRRRAPITTFKDWLRARVTRHEPTMDERLDALVWRLENNMYVTAGPVGDGTVTIELYWPDGEMAYRIIERARQAFLDARQVAETSAISESITILERYSASLHEDVNRTLGELQRTQAQDRAGDTPRPRVVTRRAAAPAPGAALSAVDAPFVPDSEMMQLKSQLTGKRQELDKLEQERRRQLSDLQARLTALQTMFTPAHPSVVTVQQNIAAFQHESPQIVSLRSGVEELETKYDVLAAADADRLIQYELSRRAAAPPPVEAPRDTPQVEQAPAAPRQSDTTQFASLRLRTELNQLQSILERTDGARIELAVSEAAFKYRYTVIKPAQVPRDPISPNLRMVFLAGLLASLFLAVAVAVGSDVMSNRILEPWQVERQLGLTILGTVRIA